jgi:hypothetical protein
MAVGSRVGAAIADHLVRSVISTKVQMADHHVDLAMGIQEAFFGLTGQELAANFGPILRRLVETGELDPSTARMLTFIAKGRGQLATLVGHAVAGTAISTGLGALLTNFLQPATGRLIAQNPALPIGIDAVARAAATGQMNGLDGAFEAAQQGIDGRKLGILTDLARPDPDIGVILELVNRNELMEADGLALLRRMGFRGVDAQRVMSTRHTLIDPSRLADAVVFGAIGQDEAAIKALHAGLPREDFDLLVRANGQPPDPQTLAFALRRGVIDHPTYVKGLTQGPLRNEWIPLMERIVLQPMSVEAAIEGAVQGALSEAQSREIAAQNGLVPEHWKPLYDIAGNPPGVQEMVAMWHRGILTRGQLEQGIRESRLKNKYVQPVIDASETLPPEDTIGIMVREGSITLGRGLDLLRKRGFSADIAQALIDKALAQRHAKSRDLAESQIVELYQDEAIDATRATDMLTSLGYGADEAAMILALYDLRRLRQFRQAVVARIRSAYVTRHIDDNEVVTALDATSTPPEQREQLVQLWSLEREVSTKELTLAQVHAAMKAGLIDAAEFNQRLRGMGYAQPDADLLTALYVPRQG